MTDDRPQTPSPGIGAIDSPMQGTVVSIAVSESDVVQEGQTLCVLESMKMEHEIAAPAGGIVHGVAVGEGDTVLEGQRLLLLEPADLVTAARVAAREVDLGAIREDLAEVIERHARTKDGSRPEAVEEGAPRVSAPPGRTSRISATPGASWNTRRWLSPRSAGGVPWTTSSSEHRRTG